MEEAFLMSLAVVLKKRNAIKILGTLWCLAFSQAHVAGLDDYICSKLIIISEL